MKTKQKLQLIQDSALQGVVEAQTKAMGLVFKASSWSERKRKALVAAMLLGVFSFNSAVAFAAERDCGGGAAEKLVEFIGGIAQFVMMIAGGLAILMFVIGAAYIIAGAKQSNVSKGIGFLKNAAIGLGVLILAFFLREIIETFSKGLGGGLANTECTEKSGNQLS